MSARLVWTVFAKEMRETIRDRRTLVVMLVVPIFLYPALLVILQQLVLLGQRSLEERPAVVAVSGATPAELDFLRGDSALSVISTERLSLGGLREGETDAVLAFPTGEGAELGTERVRLLFDGSRDASRRARQVLEARLEAWGDSLLARRLQGAGLPGSFATPLVVADSSVASAERLGGYTIGRLLPAILVVMTLLGAFFPAIDLTAGEKERGTLETLLTTPTSAREVVTGKFLAVLATAVATAALNLASMLLTFESGVFQMTRGTELQFRIPVATAGMVLLVLVPLAVFFAALFLGIAVRAHSFKEAQNSLTPVQFAVLVPIYLPMIPGISLSYLLALVPLGGIALLFRDLMMGQAQPGPALVTVAAMVAYAALTLRFAVRAFGREEVLFGSESGAVESLGLRDRLAGWRQREQGVPGPAAALAFVAVVGLLYFYLGVRLRIVGLERGLFASQWLFLALPAVAFAVLGPYRARRALALRAPSPRALLAAVLIIAGGIPIAWVLGWLQSLVLEVPEQYLQAFEQLLAVDSPARLAWILLLVALTPAICEELVFRGVLLQGFARELSPWRAVVGSAVVFGTFHLSFETVIRFLPTAWLGLLLGYVTWRTGSVFPSMLMHFLNNATAVLLVSATGLHAWVTGPSGAPRGIAVAASVVLLVAGVLLLPRRPAGDPSPAATGGADPDAQQPVT